MHFPTPTMMREMLESEGVTFKDETVVMSAHYWEPE